MSEPDHIEEPRKLTTEELYSDLQKQNRSLRFEIGQLKSQIDELNYEKLNLQKQLHKLYAFDQDTIHQVRKEKMYQVIRDLNSKLARRIWDLRETNNYLITKLNQK
jgi:predicted RNase H-like nuclease (RuvC/YqgF family)